MTADVVVVGSGAGGMTVAGELSRAGARVLIIEAGSALTAPPGSHAQNRDTTEAGLPAFADYIESKMTAPGRSPAPDEIPGLVVLHAVGGMLTAWTHNCPTPDPTELPDFYDVAQWAERVSRARELLGVTDALWNENADFMRLLDRVRSLVGKMPEHRQVAPMPVAVKRRDGVLHWTGGDDLLGETGAGEVTILSDHVAREVLTSGSRATAVRAVPVGGGAGIEIQADTLVIAAGTIGTAQLIAASGMDAGDAFGHYLMEHVTVCTRVLLRDDLRVPDNGVDSTFGGFGIWIPYSSAHPWHSQLVRHPLYYAGVLPDGYDIGDTSDLIAMCSVAPNVDNRLEFLAGETDDFGLPRVHGRLELSPQDHRQVASAVAEQLFLCAELGDIRNGWSTSLLSRGSSTHVMGSCRMGASDDGTSVVSANGRLWHYDNCYVAGNAVFASTNGSNPTLSTVAYALGCADEIRGRSFES